MELVDPGEMGGSARSCFSPTYTKSSLILKLLLLAIREGLHKNYMGSWHFSGDHNTCCGVQVKGRLMAVRE